MNNNKLNFFTFAVFTITCSIIFTACSHTQTSATFSPLQPEENEAIIYIYRPSTASNALYSPDFYVNDEYRITIKNGFHYHLTFVSGEYGFKLEREDRFGGNSLNPKALAAGSVHYYRVETTLKLNNSTNYQPYQREFTLSEVEEPLALRQIAECCLKKDTKAEGRQVEKTSTPPAFSVDKTQNPFSH